MFCYVFLCIGICFGKRLRLALVYISLSIESMNAAYIRVNLETAKAITVHKKHVTIPYCIISGLS